MLNHRITFWLRRNISRIALILGFCSVIEIFVHLTDGTEPVTRIPLEYWVPFVSALGVASFAVAWWLYIPPARHDELADKIADEPSETGC
jgi:hypothetical protein